MGRPAPTIPLAPSIPTEKSAICMEPPFPWFVPSRRPNNSAIIRLMFAPFATYDRVRGGC